ncbi:MAG: urease accessory protein UreE [Pseudomonadota bacterium]
MSDLPRATEIDTSGEPTDDFIELPHFARVVRRKRATSNGGFSFLIDLPGTTSVSEGDAFVLLDGTRIGVKAAQEQCFRVTGTNLARAAYHVGNRHAAVEFGPGYLTIIHDNTLASMLRQLGCIVSPYRGPFNPEGGAFGHGHVTGHGH